MYTVSEKNVPMSIKKVAGKWMRKKKYKKSVYKYTTMKKSVNMESP
jgi:hypothetical protein